MIVELFNNHYCKYQQIQHYSADENLYRWQKIAEEVSIE